MNKKIILFTGGTGGHVLPAINYGNHLLSKGYSCSIIIDKRGIRYSSKFNGKLYIIKSSHLSGNIFFKMKSLLDLMIGFIQSFYYIIKIRPYNCISFGSYATLMPMLAVSIIRIIYKIHINIHEQNSIIGKVNLLFLPYVDWIFSNFNDLDNLKNKYLDKKIYVGMPIDESLKYNYSKKKIDTKIKTIFVYGGSQGSIQLVNKFLLMISNTDQEYLNKIKIIIQCPKKIYSSTKKTLIKFHIDYIIEEFFENIDYILPSIDLAVTRAGAGTINDLIRYRIPSIIIPLPHSIYNHQFYNAKYLSSTNATILINENNFNEDKNLKIFEELIKDDNKIKNMIKKLSMINLPNANSIMTKKILL